MNIFCRQGVQELVDDYVNTAYKKDCSRCALSFNQGGQLQVDISCINVNLGQFWVGEWQSKWEVDITGQTLKGTIKVNNHYWENGNIQFHLSKSFTDETLDSADAAVIVAKIRQLESSYQTVVEETLEHSKEDMFKRMRRVLPITGRKYDWTAAKSVMI